MQNDESEKSAVPKVCRMWFVMECSFDKESEQKIYLPTVLVQKEKKKKAKRVMLILLKGAKKCVKPILKALFGATAGMITAMWIVPEVTAQRGYSAIGGEYLLIILSAFVAIHIADRLIKFDKH